VARRIAVVGGSGSGKSTVARRLAERHQLAYVELDALHWGPNWTPCPDDEFRARVEAATAGEAWVVDGDYTGKVGELVLERAELIVWLDLPLRVTLPRLWSRTRRRMREKTELWGGNRESWGDVLFSRDSLFVYTLRIHLAKRRRYAERSGRYEIVRLRSSREIEDWLGR
jgi:adenylate kinase family enzyme